MINIIDYYLSGKILFQLNNLYFINWCNKVAPTTSRMFYSLILQQWYFWENSRHWMKILKMHLLQIVNLFMPWKIWIYLRHPKKNHNLFLYDKLLQYNIGKLSNSRAICIKMHKHQSERDDFMLVPLYRPLLTHQNFSICNEELTT